MKTPFYLILFYYNINLIYGQHFLELNNDSLIQKAMLVKQANKEQAINQSITHFVMKNSDGTFGYSIFINGNMAFYQPNIPAVSGNKGFEKWSMQMW